MALTKQSFPINFSKGLDTKSDPLQVSPGNFISLENTVFTKAGLLAKRNGYTNLTPLPTADYSYLTTFNGNLTAIGNSLAAYNASNNAWVIKGHLQPCSLTTLPLIRNNINQTQSDSVVAPNGLVLTTYTETDGATTFYKYVVANSITGQNIVAPTALTGTGGVVSGDLRVFLLATHFVIGFTVTIGGTHHLQYISINTANPSQASAPADLAVSYAPASTGSWDGFIFNNKLYFAYNTTAGGQSVSINYLSQSFILATPRVLAGETATIMSVTVDATANLIYISYYNSGSSVAKTAAVDVNLNVILNPTVTYGSGNYVNLTSVATNGVCTIYGQLVQTYSYDSNIRCDLVSSVTINRTGTVGSILTVIRGVGLASKAFMINGTNYFLGAVAATKDTTGNIPQYQPSYFLINGSTSQDLSPVIVAKLAYQNGGGYITSTLPSVTVTGTSAYISYLFKDLIQAVNKNTNVPAGSQVAGIYAQLGINLVTFTITTASLDTAEIGSNLQISGGYLSMYDGYLPVESNAFLYPDNIELVGSNSGGVITAGTYYYQVTYEWADNQGNLFRSAPSIPVTVTTTGATSSVVINIPTLRLTQKVANPVKIVVYRWSVAQQVYYQVTSITTPTLNSTTVNQVAFTDTLSDTTILGNNIIYTTGGVIENVNAPATDILTLFDTRLWLVDSEDRNLLWYSKQVIEATPVEMSDLLTVFVPPTTASQGPTGPITALSVMDDKLIIFKNNAIYYINGSGPDNTGANNQYSQPVFITSTVGCTNQKSIVFMPNGLMFQSDKGIWLLGRDLNTSYIGAAVEQFNGQLVESAINVAGQNQVRFTMSGGVTLMYDYFYSQWGTFVGIPGISSCLYNSLHTFINSLGQVLSESVGAYLDGARPVLMSFTTGWMNLAGLQGYERVYFFYLLGQYVSPHTLNVEVAYNYNPSPSQSVTIKPTNYAGTWGSNSVWGGVASWGGNTSLEQWRVFTNEQRCQAFQITVQENFDSQFATVPGAGLTLSGINMVVGTKRGYRPIKAADSIG